MVPLTAPQPPLLPGRIEVAIKDTIGRLPFDVGPN